MGCILCAAVIAIITIAILKLVDKIRKLFKIPPLPYLEETWWGPRSPLNFNRLLIRKNTEFDWRIGPIISVADEVIEDLNQRLKNARPFTVPLEGVQHQYGINAKLLTEIIDFWKTKYNWREREIFLNKYPQFTVSIQGLRIHYIHVKPTNLEGRKVLPLLLLHGWPGSVREFYEIIPLLTSPQPGRNFVFEVFAPSLPGYGFSEAAVRPGLGAIQMAVLFKNFMKQMGHTKYYIQGGDWGAVITSHMATLYPEHVLGLHSNMCSVRGPLAYIKLFFYSHWPTLLLPKEHVDKVFPVLSKLANMLLESGYMHLQATRPDTVGVALNDSPVGLAAYILEKFIVWTHKEWKNLEDGGLTRKYTYTDLLDNVMIYWVTNSITTSMRLYSETLNKSQMSMGVDKIPVTVPTAVARFAHDLVYSPTPILKQKYKNIVHVSDHEGGHFAAFETPKVLADDIFEGVEKMELYYKNNVQQ